MKKYIDIQKNKIEKYEKHYFGYIVESYSMNNIDDVFSEISFI